MKMRGMGYWEGVNEGKMERGREVFS